MKKKWLKPKVTEMKIKKVTLGGSNNGTENQNGANKKILPYVP